MARPLEELTLLDIHRAVGEPSIFAVGPAFDMPGCPIEQAVKDVLNEAEELLRKRFAAVSLADVARTFPHVDQDNGREECSSQTMQASPPHRSRMSRRPWTRLV
ncbi:hypothetical protein [Rhizobium skierniewicense]|uniref:hypothetical protein n=1 Tax=Rhizobium skierniewicense TaxID=984260 RepID=UPI003306F393